MFSFTVVRQIAFILPLLVGALSPAVAQAGVDCGLSGNGELASGDYFKVNAAIYTDFSAKGSLMHATPWQSKAPGTCPRILLERARVCRELERLDMSSPQCPGNSKALEENADCVQNVLKGTVEAGLCARDARTIVSLGGAGAWNGRPGYIFNVTARDGTPDHYAIVITGPDGMPIEYTASGNVVSGDTRTTKP